MKKIYTSALAVALLSGSAFAQQLPNVGFDNWKETCGESESFMKPGGSGAEGFKLRPGIEPTGWNGSSVNHKVVYPVIKELVTKVESDNGTAVELRSAFVGISSLGSVAPAFLTLGTPWVAADLPVADCDGGVYGGIDFTYRPDALSIDVERLTSTGEEAAVIAYGWNGTFTSKVGMKSLLDQERNDVDRAIMGYASDDIVTARGELVYKLDQTILSTNAEWKNFVFPFTYTSSAAPEKLNVTICAGNYWDRSALKDKSHLIVDNVKLLYYSRLSDLSVNGSAIADFASDKYNYTVDALLPEASAISYTALGASGSARVNVQLDEAKAQAIITVTNTNEGGLDVDGEAQHVYTLQFNAKPAEVVETAIYKGSLYVDLLDQTIENQPITMFTMSDGTYTMLLENFGGDENNPAGMGTIRVEGITNTDDGLHGYAPEIVLADGQITADATVTGTMSGDNISLEIACMWKDMNLPINVTFEGAREQQKVSYTFRRKYLDGSSRYYNRIAATVNEVETVLHETADAKQESYYVAPVQGSWQEEGAYIDLTDNVVDVPEGTATFTVNLRSNGSGTTSTKWSQNAVYVDWNDNGEFTDEGETKGVMDVEIKPNQGTGNVTVTPMGMDVDIEVPATAKDGDTRTMLICLMEPKNIETGADRWADHWDWSKDIFADGVCSLMNGQAYAFTVKMTAPSAISNVAVDANAPVEYFNLQGVRVAADNLIPGIYVRRQGGKVVKVFVK